ncbi:MAG TPA: septal ring lytic transglycosylase RlpA family protein [Rhizomicrobium sp.]|nr:septal ring lytic transglycosylase RlpA family protein [Rhizomicrobium sp.]
MKLQKVWQLSAVGALGVLAAACSSTSDLAPPPNGGVYKVGQPYQINGSWYYPKEQPDYEEEGIASWYGPTFYGHKTANGEVFDADAMTAAHRTLPMPVNVRVTNLDNGRTAILRVNDRGPYARSRIIDVSEHAADVLGFKSAGTAHVRVTYLARADGNAPAPNFDDNSVASSTHGNTMTAVASPSESPSGATVMAVPTGVVQTAALGATTVMTASGPAIMQRVPPPDVVAAPLPAPSMDSSSSDDPPVQVAQNAAQRAPTPIGGNDLPPGASRANQTGGVMPSGADAAETRSDLTPTIGGDPNAPAPPPFTEHSDAGAMGQTVVSADAGPAPMPASVSAPVPRHPAESPVAARTHIYVQAGAFGSRSNADHLISLLSDIGSFFVSPVERAGTELYRVRMGPFDDVGDATAALAKVTGLGNTGAKIVVDQ